MIDEETEPTRGEANRDREGAENIFDREHDTDRETPNPFETIETGVLERDIATHEAVLLEETDEGEVLDLGRVEGLSAAPSVLRNMVVSTEDVEEAESDTMKKPE
ncbi:MAG: hypothetical protein JOZ58_04515 [Acetobacteraceae bacterium]|nr:hypothetical protein [Acetobacteraceae bacterium]